MSFFLEIATGVSETDRLKSNEIADCGKCITSGHGHDEAHYGYEYDDYGEFKKTFFKYIDNGIVVKLINVGSSYVRTGESCLVGELMKEYKK